VLRPQGAGGRFTVPRPPAGCPAGRRRGAGCLHVDPRPHPRRRGRAPLDGLARLRAGDPQPVRPPSPRLGGGAPRRRPRRPLGRPCARDGRRHGHGGGVGGGKAGRGGGPRRRTAHHLRAGRRVRAAGRPRRRGRPHRAAGCGRRALRGRSRVPPRGPHRAAGLSRPP